MSLDPITAFHPIKDARMSPETHSQIANFIWSICNLLRGPYKRNEYRKVTWPSQKEAVGGTIGVVVIVAVITLVLGVVDAVLGKLIQFILP